MGGALEDLTAAVQAQGEQIAALTAQLDELAKKIQPRRAVWTLKDLAELPESPSIKTLYNWRSKSPEKLPGHGKPDGFTRDSLAGWLDETVQAWRRQLMPMPFAIRGNPDIGKHRSAPSYGGSPALADGASTGRPA
jgi:hypothetical protein